jgi:hypothetical protein
VTLQEHANAIANAIQAAHNDGFQLDNGEGECIHEMDLNEVDGDRIGAWASIDLPTPTYY